MTNFLSVPVAGLRRLARYIHAGAVRSQEAAVTNDTKTPQSTLPQGWPPEQPTVEVGMLLRLAKWGVAGIVLCIALLTTLIVVLIMDKQDAQATRERIVEILASKER